MVDAGYAGAGPAAAFERKITVSDFNPNQMWLVYEHLQLEINLKSDPERLDCL